MQIHKRITTKMLIKALNYLYEVHSHNCTSLRRCLMVTDLQTLKVQASIHRIVAAGSCRCADFERKTTDASPLSTSFLYNQRQESISRRGNTAQTHAAIKFVYIA